ncbi:uncharacterized protein LOC141679079 [Apium graveolens]|uniref:uncharacterized protein LOC141679079 n=1 Tax=Apium graveolens TaxID=4045 RepID=UPI003D7C11B1
MTFLMKMSNDFANVRSHILMMDNLPNLPQVYRMLLQEQRHKEISKVPNVHEPVAFAIDRTQNNFKQSFGSQNFNNRNSSGRTYTGYSNNSSDFQQRKPAYFYDHCKILGHSRERCFKLNGFSPGFKPNQQRKFAAYASTENVEATQPHVIQESDTGSQTMSTTLSMEQYNQLLHLLAQNNTTEQESSHSGNALLAGAFNESNQTSW